MIPRIIFPKEFGRASILWWNGRLFAAFSNFPPCEIFENGCEVIQLFQPQLKELLGVKDETRNP